MNKTNPESDPQPRIYNQQGIVLEIAYYSQMDNKSETVIAAYHKKKQDSPLRKRYHKRKRRVRNPAQGK